MYNRLKGLNGAKILEWGDKLCIVEQAESKELSRIKKVINLGVRPDIVMKMVRDLEEAFRQLNGEGANGRDQMQDV